MTARVAAGHEELGTLKAVGVRLVTEQVQDLLRAVAQQVALALKQAELTERVSELSGSGDLFDALAAGRLDDATKLTRSARVDLDRAHALLHVEPASDAAGPQGWLDVTKRVQQQLLALSSRAFCRERRESLSVLLPLPEPGPTAQGELDRALDVLGARENVLIGRSGARWGAGGWERSRREAADAMLVAAALRPGGGALAYDSLGAYKYLIRMPPEDPPNDVCVAAVEKLVDYDRRRGAQLTDTLERYLLDQRSVRRAARGLHIHPNTLRQRLGRIEQLSGLELATENSLALELAIKLVRLRFQRAVEQPPDRRSC
jgi:hypothetical protein